MEHYQLWHHPFAEGRIENGLPPAPRVMDRPFYIRWAEAVSVLVGKSVGIRCHPDIELPAGKEETTNEERIALN